MDIDLECEKAMIQFVYYHKAIRFAELDAIWREFLRIYPVPDISVSELKTHFLCLDKSDNKWDVDEDAYLYFKHGSHVEEMDFSEHLNEEPQESDVPPSRKLLVTFEGKQNLNRGQSLATLQLCKEALRDDLQSSGQMRSSSQGRRHARSK